MGQKIIVPKRADPRWLILAYLLSFCAYAMLAPDFGRSAEKFAASFVTCVLLDFALLRLKGLPLLPLSGVITAMGTFLLCESPSVWPYAFVAACSILSKHLLRVEGRHIFNPNNFGIVVGLLYESGDVTVVAGRWGGSPWAFAGVFLLGLYTAYRARRLDLATAYVGAALAANALRTAGGLPWAMAFGPMTGAAFQLFTFFMITDPMTTPSDRRGRILFGLLLGLLDVFLRSRGLRNAPFYALFVMTALRPVWDRSVLGGPWISRPRA